MAHMVSQLPDPLIRPMICFRCDRCGPGPRPIEEPCKHRDRKVFIDGIQVQESQMTKEEFQAWYPEVYSEKYGPPEVKCPYCSKMLSMDTNKMAVGHIRQSHPKEYKKQADRMRETADLSVTLKNIDASNDDPAEAILPGPKLESPESGEAKGRS